MAEGEVKEISDMKIVDDLLDAGYIEEVIPAKAEKEPEKKPEPKPEPKKKTTTRKKKTTTKK